MDNIINIRRECRFYMQTNASRKWKQKLIFDPFSFRLSCITFTTLTIKCNNFVFVQTQYMNIHCRYNDIKRNTSKSRLRALCNQAASSQQWQPIKMLDPILYVAMVASESSVILSMIIAFTVIVDTYESSLMLVYKHVICFGIWAMSQNFCVMSFFCKKKVIPKSIFYNNFF